MPLRDRERHLRRPPRVAVGSGHYCGSLRLHPLFAFDQNIFTEWHSRYRRAKRGVLIYWTVDTAGAMAIHSQLLQCSASEVHAMGRGRDAARHGMSVESNYVDSHGASFIGFASPGCWIST